MQNIALAFSGGGFRAACFSLGSLSYLNKIHYKGRPLLQHVKFISSTSGGSITNLVYSSYTFRGKNFDDCYAFLMKELDGEKLLARALQILRSSDNWKQRPAKSRNLINAFSIAYDELLEHQAFGIYSSAEHASHLEEICVNSTEFSNGLPFRFQSQNKDINFPKGRIGNQFIYFTYTGQSAAANMKLADLLACSSCFPSGFEPMIFPDDFTHASLDAQQLRHAISYRANAFTIPKKNIDDESDYDTDQDDELLIDPITGETVSYNNLDILPNEEYNKDLRFGIMDGGVADNQAIDAFKKANERRENNSLPPFDLLIACDVTSHYMDGYTLPMENDRWYSDLTPKILMICWILLMLILPALFLLPPPWKGWMFVAATVSSIAILPAFFLLLKKIKSIFSKREKGTFNNMLSKYAGTFMGLRLGVLKQMLASRVKSVFILANDIYLKQIRRMYYEDMFNDERFKGKVIQNAIYTLSRIKFDPDDISTDELQPSNKMIEVAEKARTMGTTLWFDKHHQANNIKEAIVATGQFTTCYNLLQHISQLPPEQITRELQQLKDTLIADWEEFNNEPVMYAEALASGQVNRTINQ